MARIKLTEAVIPTLAPGLHHDAELLGFMMGVGKHRRTWLVQYDYRDPLSNKRHTRRLSLGRWPEMKAQEARGLARKALAERERRPQTQAPTLAEALDWYITEVLAPKIAKGERSQRTADGYRSFVTRHLADLLQTPLSVLAEHRQELIALYNKLYAVSKGNAVNTFSALRSIYKKRQRVYPKELPEPNPVSWDLIGPDPRDTAIPLSDLAEWYEALQQVPCPIRREFHLFTLLSGMRTTAIEEMRWEHVDFARRGLFVPTPKGGRRKNFWLPLSSDMVKCLERVRIEDEILCPGSPWVFVSAGSASGHIQENKQKGLGFINGHQRCGHCLRHTWASARVAAGVSKDDADLVLNHGRKDIGDKYIGRTAIWDFLVGEMEKVSRLLMAHCLQASPRVIPLWPTQREALHTSAQG